MIPFFSFFFESRVYFHINYDEKIDFSIELRNYREERKQEKETIIDFFSELIFPSKIVF